MSMPRSDQHLEPTARPRICNADADRIAVQREAITIDMAAAVNDKAMDNALEANRQDEWLYASVYAGS